jgi:hypothetical protein
MLISRHISKFCFRLLPHASHTLACKRRSLLEADFLDEGDCGLLMCGDPQRHRSIVPPV